MSFNAKEYLDSIAPPVYVDTKGKTHTGRVLSYEEWLPFEFMFQEAVKNELPQYPVVKRVVKDLARVMFPRPWYQKLNPFYRSVARDVLSLPPMGMLKAFMGFTEAQATAMGVEKLGLADDPPASESDQPDT